MTIYNHEFERLLRLSVEMGASDMHITVGSPPVFRIDGELKVLDGETVNAETAERYARSIMNEQQYQIFKEQGEIDFSIGIHGFSRFRINAYHQRGSISIASRIIPTRIPSLEELQLPAILKELTYKPQGLILVTGPTGSGKSTTLASMIDYINRTQRKHIVTLEDPIEYLHAHHSCIINQREIGSDSKSFANALRASLRQDPDVILLGEMRDLETISTAITAAETGHLVLATLHTTDAPSTIDRIIDAFPGHQQAQIRVQLASVLVAVISQRLFPKKGAKGRICVTEILISNSAVANLIRQEKVHQIKSIMQTSRAAGMHTMEMTIESYLQQGLIEEQIARQYLPQQLIY
jgi:twitching motility protein PilT